MPEGKSSTDLKIKMVETVEKVEYSIGEYQAEYGTAALMELVNEASRERHREKARSRYGKTPPPSPFLLINRYTGLKGEEETILEGGFFWLRENTLLWRRLNCLFITAR